MALPANSRKQRQRARLWLSGSSWSTNPPSPCSIETCNIRDVRLVGRATSRRRFETERKRVVGSPEDIERAMRSTEECRSTDGSLHTQKEGYRRRVHKLRDRCAIQGRHRIAFCRPLPLRRWPDV